MQPNISTVDNIYNIYTLFYLTSDSAPFRVHADSLTIWGKTSYRKPLGTLYAIPLRLARVALYSSVMARQDCGTGADERRIGEGLGKGLAY